MLTTVTVFNKLHYPLEVEGYTFQPGKATPVKIETTSVKFHSIRTTNGLRINRNNNENYMPQNVFKYNMVQDIHRSGLPDLDRGGYVNVVRALGEPIIKHLPESGFTNQPALGINIRFFSELRITQQGKHPIGPNDIFYSHGIGDKGYWTADKIAGYKRAMVPGPTWKKRIAAGGYKGEIFIVGYTKLDPLFNGEYKKNDYGKPCVTWAPTHVRVFKNAGSSFPWCVKLIDEIPDNYEKILALHPTSRLNTKQAPKVSMQELVDADVVIADAGSTLYEAWALGKPVIFPDWLCKNDVLAYFKKDPGNLEYRIYNEQIGYHAKDMKELIKMIDIAINKGMKQQAIDFMEGVFPSALRGKAGKECAKVLSSLL